MSLAPMVVHMSVALDDVTVPMIAETQYESALELETLNADTNTIYEAPPGKAYNKVSVSVPGPSGVINIIENGSYNVADKAVAEITVPNSYTQADEGKVVSNGSLVSQAARTVDANGTYDTTTNDSVTVSVPPVLEHDHSYNNANLRNQDLGHLGFLPMRRISPRTDVLVTSSKNVTLTLTRSGIQYVFADGETDPYNEDWTVRWETSLDYLGLWGVDGCYLIVVPAPVSSVLAKFPSAGTYVLYSDGDTGTEISWTDGESFNGFSDSGKVVNGLSLEAQTVRSVTENGTYDTTTNRSVIVDVAVGKGYKTGSVVLEQTSQILQIMQDFGFAPSIIKVYMQSPVYNSNGAIGAVYIASIGSLILGSNDTIKNRCYSVLETRTSYADYAGVQSNNTTSYQNLSVSANGASLPCRNGSYPFLAGTYIWEAYE